MAFKFNPEKIGNYIQEFFSTLEKGDVFHLGKRKVTVVSVVKKPFKDFKFASEKAKNASQDLSMNEVVKFDVDGETVIMRYLYGSYHSKATKKSDRGAQLARDIEGVLLVDSINSQNPLHEPSDILKIIEKRLM
jgi:hypothetical protein